jgi:2-(1,2-epoxy-1,2-dihydrophenyl)acetyl-CoA isomerase
MTAPNVLLVDKPAAHVVRLLINRPDKRNAIDFDVREQMFVALEAALADEATRAIVLGGVGGVFSAGGDVASMEGLDEAGARARMQHIHRLCRRVADAPVPVVSAIEGIAAGAAVGLALLGDWIVVGAGTRVLFPFLKLGLAPDWGQLLTLPRRVGLPMARRLVTRASPLPGAEALAIGLADEQVADADVMATAIAKASEWARLPLGAFARTKARLNHPSPTLDAELAREEDDQVALLRGPEFSEGFAAFKEKRAAGFLALARPPWRASR